MTQSVLALISLLAPGVLLFYAAYALMVHTGRAMRLSITAQVPAVVGLIISLISIALIYIYGEIVSPLLGWNGLGFSIRLDMLSVLIMTMITILGLVIMRYSENYMDGDPRKNVFMARLAVTIASVELLVLSNNLFQLLTFWIITSICLHYLLVFYRHRPQAVAAARKKFIVARVGDLSLFIAVILLYSSFGTGDFTIIFAEVGASNGLSFSVALATILMVTAALLKSAQFPTHGWLIEVVETPTPVSALLHAGLLNAGPFLMVRFGYLLSESTTSSVMLVVIGGFTALIASIIFMTQPSIKVSLGYSSVAHMGFSLLLSGLGLYAAAILHIVAHSFYKGHAFLSSGSIVDAARTKGIISSKRLGHPILIMFSIVASIVIFVTSSYLLGFNLNDNFSLLFVCAVIIMGLSQFMVQIIDSQNSGILLASIALVSVAVSFSFLGLEHLAGVMLVNQIPDAIIPHMAIKISAVILFVAFATVIVIQLIAPGLKKTALAYRLGIHLRNGLYANVLFDRVIGSLKPEKFKWANLNVKEEVDTMPHRTGEEEVSTLLKRAEVLVNN